MVDISKAWIRPEISREQSLLIPFLIALLSLALLEAFLTRISWRPSFATIHSLIHHFSKKSSGQKDEVDSRNKESRRTSSLTGRTGNSRRKKKPIDQKESPDHKDKESSDIVESENPELEKPVSLQDRFNKAKRR